MKICIVVPIKTINKRLPGKTFKLLNGKPLYSYLFNTLKKAKKDFVDEIYVDSSDDNVLEIAKEWGFKTFKRPEEYNADSIAGDDLILRIIDKLGEYDIIGWLHITSPFLSVDSIKKSVDTMKNNPELDSVFGTVPRYNRFWYQDAPVNHDIINLVRTQDLVPIQEEADFYFFKKESFKKYKKRVCGKIKLIEVSDIEGVDIDNLPDFLYAETLIKAGLVNFE